MVLSSESRAVVDNPFSAHRIRPGEIPYLFTHEDEATDPTRLDSLVDAWQTNGYVGKIVGAHGCGKTTLACAIAKRAMENPRHGFVSATLVTIRAKALLRSSSRWLWLPRLLRLRSIEVSAGEAIFPAGSNETNATRSTKSILVIDGIERLTLSQQAAVVHSAKRQQVPILFTTHRISRPLRMLGNACPVLFRAKSDIRVFAKIVNLMTETCEPIDQVVVEEAFRFCHGNVREALMKLYDAYEAGSSC